MTCAARGSRAPAVAARRGQGDRDYLDSQGYVEVETPILSKSTRKAREIFGAQPNFMPGKRHALPQAPQQHKQLLMIAGVEKYFQIAKCFSRRRFASGLATGVYPD